MSDSELILLQEESSPEVSPGMAETAGSLDGGNQPTEVELLARAKDRVDDNDRSLRSAAEALALAKELYGTSQAEMAYAVGKSPGWVSQLLSWHRSGFKGESPFGPKTKAGRLQHAKELAASGKARPRKAGRNVASVESENAPINWSRASRSWMMVPSRRSRSLAELRRPIARRYWRKSAPCMKN